MFRRGELCVPLAFREKWFWVSCNPTRRWLGIKLRRRDINVAATGNLTRRWLDIEPAPFLERVFEGVFHRIQPGRQFNRPVRVAARKTQFFLVIFDFHFHKL